MKKTIITAYGVDGREVKEIKLIKVTGLYKKPVYHVKYECSGNSATSYFVSELYDNEIFLKREDAIKYLNEDELRDLELKKKAKAFSDFCKKNHVANPFVRIGEVNVTLRNVDAIKGITDPILRCFIEYNFPFYTHLSDVQKEIKELTKD